MNDIAWSNDFDKGFDFVKRLHKEILDLLSKEIKYQKSLKGAPQTEDDFYTHRLLNGMEIKLSKKK